MSRKGPTSFEGMIGLAILGDDKEKDLQMGRVECKSYAMQQMFCKCGGVLDQTRTNILKDEKGQDLVACCDKCREKAMTMLRGKTDLSGLAGWTFTNWDGTELVVPAAEEPCGS